MFLSDAEKAAIGSQVRALVEAWHEVPQKSREDPDKVRVDSAVRRPTCRRHVQQSAVASRPLGCQ